MDVPKIPSTERETYTEENTFGTQSLYFQVALNWGGLQSHLAEESA